MVDVAVVSLQVEVQPAVLILIAKLRREHALAGEVGHEVIVHLWCYKRRAGLWCAVLIAKSDGEHLAVGDVDVGTELHATRQELSQFAVSVAVVSKHTVAHVALTTHVIVVESSCEEVMHVAEILRVGGPDVSLTHLDLVVVAKLVAFSHKSVGVVEVVLYAWVGDAVSAEGVSVDVVVIIASEQVVHLLVVASAVLSEDDTTRQDLLFGELSLKSGGEVEHQVVVVLRLNVIERVSAGTIAGTVGCIESVEVDLPVGLGGLPPVDGPLPLSQCELIVAHVAIPHLVVAAGHVFPVVRLWVL